VTDACALSMASVPEDDHDRLWLAVERRIDGQRSVAIEFLERAFWSDTEKDIDTAFFVDSGLTYDGWNRDLGRTIEIQGGLPWTAGATKILIADGHAPIQPTDVGRIYRFGSPGPAWPPIGMVITGYVSATSVSARLLNDVPMSLQQQPTMHWARCVTS